MCAEQKNRLVDAHQLADHFRTHLRNNGKELCDNQLRNFQQSVEDLGKSKTMGDDLKDGICSL